MASGAMVAHSNSSAAPSDAFSFGGQGVLRRQAPVDVIPEDKIEELVARLKLISKIQAGQKLDTTSMEIFEDNWVTNKLIRSIFHTSESRTKTLVWIRAVTIEGIQIATQYGKSNDPHERGLGLLILEALKGTKTGFPGLKGTYKSDKIMESRIEAHELFLNLQIEELEALYTPRIVSVVSSAMPPAMKMARDNH